MYLVAASFGTSVHSVACPLEGSWRSDRELSMSFIANHSRLEKKTEIFLAEILGHLETRFEKGVASLEMPDLRLMREGEEKLFEGFQEQSEYELLYCTEKVAVAMGKEAVTGKPLVTTYNFPEPNIMWVYIGNEDSAFPNLHIREYFRRKASE